MLKTFPGTPYLLYEDEVAWLRHLLVNLCRWLTISSFYNSIPLALMFVERDGGLSTLYYSCWFAYQKKLLKTFPGIGYLPLSSRTMTFTGKFVYISHHFILLWLYPLALRLIGKDSDKNTLCHSCHIVCRQSVLKTFRGSDYLCWENGVAWLYW